MIRPRSNARWLFPLDRLANIRSTAFRPLSSTVTSPKTAAADDLDETEKKHPQAFVKANLSPGEWDINRTDPYFRPKPHPRSNMISAEDFANRPPVGFDGEFSSYQDAMITLSWMDQKTCRAIYDAYVNMMVDSQQKHKTTSHEYIVRVLAERFQITTARAAGIIQLQHAEAQMQQHSPELLCPDQANYAEETILRNIQDAYKSEYMPLPGGGDPSRSSNISIPFIEDPVGIHGRGEPDETSRQWSKADDIYDMEERLVRANQRDEERAKILINNHLYKEDEDEREQLVKSDASAHKLVKAQAQLKKKISEEVVDESKRIITIPYPETNAKGEKRDRWKYVAQIVNTRKLKKIQHESKGIRGRRGSVGMTTSYTNNHLGNTLVEKDGELRIATVAEAKETAWKPTRTRSNEYLYEGAKKAWLERTLQGKVDVWGKPTTTRASDAIKKATAEAALETEAATFEAASEAKPADVIEAAGTTEEKVEVAAAEVEPKDTTVVEESVESATKEPAQEDTPAPAEEKQPEEAASEEKPKS